MDRQIVITNVVELIRKHPKVSGLTLMTLSSYFIYRSGYSVGEFIYYITH